VSAGRVGSAPPGSARACTLSSAVWR
jgi:hypothetical protein